MFFPQPRMLKLQRQKRSPCKKKPHSQRITLLLLFFFLHIPVKVTGSIQSWLSIMPSSVSTKTSKQSLPPNSYPKMPTTWTYRTMSAPGRKVPAPRGNSHFQTAHCWAKAFVCSTMNPPLSPPSQQGPCSLAHGPQLHPAPQRCKSGTPLLPPGPRGTLPGPWRFSEDPSSPRLGVQGTSSKHCQKSHPFLSFQFVRLIGPGCIFEALKP